MTWLARLGTISVFGIALVLSTPAHAQCLGDLDGDDSVNSIDLLAMLGEWGACNGCSADLNDNGAVNSVDLLILLAGWGPCPEELDGFLADWKPRMVPPFIDTGVGWLDEAGKGPAVEVQVDHDDQLRLVPPTVLGNNAAVWNWEGYYFDQKCIDLLRHVEHPLVRYPGGSTSNHYHWDQNYPPSASQYLWLTASWTTNFQEYIQLLQELGDARTILTVNYGYVEYGDVDAAAQLAANWVEYCNAPNDGSNPGGGVDWAAQRASDGFPDPLNCRYWEIGNEIFGSWEVGYEPNGADYAANWNVIRDAMKAIDPSILVGLVVTDAGWWVPGWTEACLGHPSPQGVPTGDRADFLIVHDYFTGGDPPADQILPTAVQIAENTEYLDQILLQHTNRQPGDLPYTLTEFHTTLYEQVARPNQLVGGLFITKVLGELISNGWLAANLWDIANGWNTEAEGDHGMLSLEHPGLPDITPYACYYSFLLYANGFGDTQVRATSTDASIVVFASSFSDGRLGVVLINESDQPRVVSLSLPDYRRSGPLQAWSFTADALDSGRIRLNGVLGPHFYGGPDPDDAPPYATVVQPGTAPQLTLPAHSATSIVVY
jgi:hypothetical protein